MLYFGSDYDSNIFKIIINLNMKPNLQIFSISNIVMSGKNIPLLV